jgi:DNA recombination protein RmuC
MGEQILEMGGYVFTLEQAGLAAGAATGVLLLLILLIAWRRAVARAELGDAFEGQVAELLRTQSEMTGRMQTMAEVFGSRQSELARGLTDRMDGLTHRLGQSIQETTHKTHENLSRLAERLAVIDKAQQNITTLSTQVVQLQHILANKQTRGAFGEGRMQAIIQDGLPSNAYEFQAKLSNGTRPDCVVLFPNKGPKLVIDAKFPLEAWNAIRAAGGPELAKAAEAQFRRDTQKHIQDIADRYHIPGETHDTAFMFVPSESIFADIHERFEDVVQRAHRARVVIVSPSLLMLSVQVVMSLLRDMQMRDQAHVIQDEVIRMMADVGRLDERVRKLQLHFGQANKDLDDILTSTKKITNSGDRIQALEFDDAAEQRRRLPHPANADGPPELPFRSVEGA